MGWQIVAEKTKKKTTKKTVKEKTKLIRSEKMEEFCQCIARGAQIVDAFMEAYKVDDREYARKKAYTLFHKDNVQQRIQEIRADNLKRGVLTRKGYLEEKVMSIIEQCDTLLNGEFCEDKDRARYMDIQLKAIDKLLPKVQEVNNKIEAHVNSTVNAELNVNSAVKELTTDELRKLIESCED